MIDMIEYGWDEKWTAGFGPWATPGCVLGRVVKQARDRATLITPHGEAAAEVSGLFQHEAAVPADFPVVGDWAVVEPCDAGTALIHALLFRRRGGASRSG